MACMNKKMQDGQPLNIVHGDVTFGVHGSHEGKEFHYIFSVAAGGLESLVLDGREWIYRAPTPTFWRALTDNDRGNQFHLKSGMWIGADQFIKGVSVKAEVNGNIYMLPFAPANNQFSDQEFSEEFEITFVYETITVPATTVSVTYHVEKTGKIQVTVHYHGKEGLPELPVFGLRMIMPTLADGFTYEGLSGETYPDRMAGGIPGVYEIEGLPVTPYLRTQDCGMHMNTKWVEVTRSTALDNSFKKKEAKTLKLTLNGLAFSCLPYTAEELENALHIEELPVPRRTVLSIYGAVRGVGGIDSWGADVEEAYHVSAEKDIEFSFVINE